MRQVILSMLVSIDGYIEGVDNDINWHVWDDEMQAYMMDFLQTIDTFIYGRKSYELMLDYWPDQKGEFADIMNQTPKIVFSTTLQKAKMNARIARGNVTEEIQKEKEKPGKDMVLFAGANIASSFIKHNLIDEYRIIVNPVVLGKGTPLFKTGKQQQLNLVSAKSFKCGNVLLTYKAKNMDRNILKAYDTATSTLIELLSSLTNEQLNIKPTKNSWTAGQVGDHLEKSYEVSKILLGEVEDTQRPPDQKLAEIRALFLNFDIKMDSPKAIVPTNDPIDKKRLLTSLEEKIQWVNTNSKNMDLSKTCLDFEIPEYGPFTRLEWIGFNTVHTQRHIHQLQQIIKTIKNDT